MKLPAYPRSKPSGVDWLGDVPETWEVKRAKWSVVGCINGVWGDEPNGVDDVTCVRVADFDRDNFLVASEPPTLRAIEPNQLKTRQLRKGDLLIEKSGGGEKQLVGCVVSFNHDFKSVCSNFVARMPVVPELPPRFWCYVHAALYAGKLNYPAIKQTTGIQNLDSSAYLDTPAPFPPPAEQRSIAAFLDRETGRVDRLVAKKRELIERLKEKRTALISCTVTRGLPPAAARTAGLPANPPLKPSGVAWLDDVPEHWKVSKLKHIKASTQNAFVDGPFGSNLKTEHFVSDGDVFVIESGFATRGELNEENLKTIEMDHFLTIKRSATTPGDIIIAKIGAYFGLNHILPPLTMPAVVSGNSLKLTVHPKSCSAAYFHYQLLYLKWCGAIDLLANITAQPALSLGGMNTLSCVQPPLPEQAAIAAYLDEETAKLDALVGKVEEAVERLQEYRTALITAAVTGKIDVRKEVDP